MKLRKPNERRNLRSHSRDVLEVEQEMTPWEQVEHWAMVHKSEILRQTTEAKNSWPYLLIALYALDLYPDMESELQLQETEWVRYHQEPNPFVRGARQDEYALGAIRFFPKEELGILMRFFHRVQDAEFSHLENGGLKAMQAALFLSLIRPERKKEWDRHLIRVKEDAWLELLQQGEIVHHVDDAARFLLVYPEMRGEVQQLITTCWNEIMVALPELKQLLPHQLARFLRDLKVIFSEQVDMDRKGGLKIQAPAGKMHGNRSPLPERPSV